MFAKLIAKLKAWFAAKGGVEHVVAGAYVAAVAAYAAVPAFAGLLNSVYHLLPTWAHEVLLAALGLAAWYKQTNKAD